MPEKYKGIEMVVVTTPGKTLINREMQELVSIVQSVQSSHDHELLAESVIPQSLTESGNPQTFSKEQLEAYHSFCSKCQCVKPPRTHHCSICRACVLQMDHHCPWTNNCVGIRNRKVFLLFNFYTFLVATVTLIRGVVNFMACRDKDK